MLLIFPQRDFRRPHFLKFSSNFSKFFTKYRALLYRSHLRGHSPFFSWNYHSPGLSLLFEFLFLERYRPGPFFRDLGISLEKTFLAGPGHHAVEIGGIKEGLRPFHLLRGGMLLQDQVPLWLLEAPQVVVPVWTVKAPSAHLGTLPDTFCDTVEHLTITVQSVVHFVDYARPNLRIYIVLRVEFKQVSYLP